MINKEKLIQSVMTAFLVVTAGQSANAAANNTADVPASEKCYGIVKAGMNDCATSNSSCAGSSTKDKQGDAFIFVPAGTCEKLVGGQLQADNKSAS